MSSAQSFVDMHPIPSIAPLTGPATSAQRSGKSFVEVFDPDFKYIYEVPSTSVAHLPPTRLNITRLVLCRNYRPCEPQSCAMGGNCKFVHADCDCARLEAHPIHVNYIWRHESLCTYPRLQAGHVLTVWAPNNKQPVTQIPSERLLVTKGSQSYIICLQSVRAGLANSAELDHAAPLSHCAHYYFNRMCNRGERCNFIHALHVDPTVQDDFKRAPGRAQHHHHHNPSLRGADGTDEKALLATRMETGVNVPCGREGRGGGRSRQPTNQIPRTTAPPFGFTASATIEADNVSDEGEVNAPVPSTRVVRLPPPKLPELGWSDLVAVRRIDSEGPFGAETPLETSGVVYPASALTAAAERRAGPIMMRRLTSPLSASTAASGRTRGSVEEREEVQSVAWLAASESMTSPVSARPSNPSRQDTISTPVALHVTSPTTAVSANAPLFSLHRRASGAGQAAPFSPTVPGCEYGSMSDSIGFTFPSLMSGYGGASSGQAMHGMPTSPTSTEHSLNVITRTRRRRDGISKLTPLVDGGRSRSAAAAAAGATAGAAPAAWVCPNASGCLTATALPCGLDKSSSTPSVQSLTAQNSAGNSTTAYRSYPFPSVITTSATADCVSPYSASFPGVSSGVTVMAQPRLLSQSDIPQTFSHAARTVTTGAPATATVSGSGMRVAEAMTVEHDRPHSQRTGSPVTVMTASSFVVRDGAASPAELSGSAALQQQQQQQVEATGSSTSWMAEPRHSMELSRTEETPLPDRSEWSGSHSRMHPRPGSPRATANTSSRQHQNQHYPQLGSSRTSDDRCNASGSGFSGNACRLPQFRRTSAEAVSSDSELVGESTEVSGSRGGRFRHDPYVSGGAPRR